ncbi:MAG: hypothetical protein SFW67_07920 [Myxococcaceae bacterium]|jgi:hypothetical protein|nr:hypothetical protein [Myxococcaceae bacterium]MDX2010100.1 hypothetical protein [Myxococcaceae bacterium]
MGTPKVDDVTFQVECITRITAIAQAQPLLPLRFLVPRILEAFTTAELARADRLAREDGHASFQQQIELTLRDVGGR